MATSAILFLVGLGIASTFIAYQDFRERLVSLWSLILFGCICLVSVFFYRDSITVLKQSVFSISYLAFIWLSLKLYLFLKYKRNQTILNELLGAADVFVILAIGITFNLPGLILFFCVSFILSALGYCAYMLFKKENTKTIPLAGLLMICYVSSIVMLNIVDLSFLIDCSFVN